MNKLTISMLLMILSTRNYCQDSIHIQVNKGSLHGLVPDYLQTIDVGQLKNRIIVYNGYNHNYKISVSKDQQQWFSLSMPNMQYAVFKQKKIYAKIMSSDSTSFTKELISDWIYALNYSFVEKKWEIVQKQKVN